MTRLADIAPRLARARDQLLAERRIQEVERLAFISERLRLERLVAHRELQFLRAHGRRYAAERARKLAQARGALERLERRGRVA